MTFSEFYHQTILALQKLLRISRNPERERLVALQNLRPLKILSSGSVLDEKIIESPHSSRSIDQMKISEAIDGFTLSEARLKEYFGEETLQALQELKLVSQIEAEIAAVNKAISKQVQNFYFQYNQGTVIGYRMSGALTAISLLLGGLGYLIFSDPIAEATKRSDQLWLATYTTCTPPFHCASPYQIVQRFTDCTYGLAAKPSDCDEFISGEALERFACSFLNLTYHCSLMLCNSQRDACNHQDVVESPYHYMLAFGLASLIIGLLIAAVSRCGLNKSKSECRIEVLDGNYNNLARSPAFIHSIAQGESISSTKNVIELLKTRQDELTERYESKLPFVQDRSCQLFSRSKVSRLLNSTSGLFKNAAQIEEISDEKEDVFASVQGYST